jgi:hypothetical protein
MSTQSVIIQVDFEAWALGLCPKPQDFSGMALVSNGSKCLYITNFGEIMALHNRSEVGLSPPG